MRPSVREDVAAGEGPGPGPAVPAADAAPAAAAGADAPAADAAPATDAPAVDAPAAGAAPATDAPAVDAPAAGAAPVAAAGANDAGAAHGPAAGAAEAPPGGTKRLLALDAARGLAIVVMLVVMNPGPTAHLPAQLHHPDWHGLTFADLFFPLFLFSIGVAMTLSSRGLDGRHVLYRASVLLVLGIALASLRHETFGRTGVLQHIAVSIVVAYLVLRLPRRYQAPVTVALVALYWVAFVVWAPGDDPWARSGTLAHEVDGVLVGGFTTEGTLQSLISAVTVLGGAFTGRLIRAVPDRRRLARAVAVRAVGLVALGLALAPVVPLNKRLWTPSFTALTIGTSLAWLALGIWLIDERGARRATAPLVHLGSNPIVIYVGFFATLSLLRNHGDALLPDIAPAGSETAGAYLYAVAWTVLWWAVAYALYRRRIFVKL